MITKKINKPDPQAVNELREHYFRWLVKREMKRLQGSKRVHWIGKKIASTQA